MSSKYKSGQPAWDRARIQALRQHLGLTQQAMAEQLGIRQQTVSEWEIGMYEPRGASLKLLSLIAEKAEFKYQAGLSEPPSASDDQPGGSQPRV